SQIECAFAGQQELELQLAAIRRGGAAAAIAWHSPAVRVVALGGKYPAVLVLDLGGRRQRRQSGHALVRRDTLHFEVADIEVQSQRWMPQHINQPLGALQRIDS